MSTPPEATSEEALEVPLWLKLGLLVGVLLVGGAGAELVVRVADGGALPHLDIYALESGRVALEPDAARELRRLNGERWSLGTGAHGMRVARAGDPVPTERWLVVGDSQALGLGVGWEDSFSGRLQLANAAVPSHGVADALTAAEALAPELHSAGVVVIVNQANDWEDGLVLASERHQVVNGWLLTREASTGFWRSPLPRVHLLYFASLLMPPGASDTPVPAWLSDPAGQASTTTALAGALHGFAEAHPELPLRVVFLPVDVAACADRVEASPFGRFAEYAPWEHTELRDQLREAIAPLPFVDLLPVLQDHPEAFLDRDYHLSPEGHRLVAEALEPALELR